MIAVLLAGGKGTRLRPLTYAVPKPLLPVGQRPLLENVILYLKQHGITEFIISVGYLGYQIKNYFGDGAKLGVKIDYVEEKEPLGTAGCLNLVRERLTETFILMGADNLTTLDLTKFIKFHKEHKGVATVALFEYSRKVEFGIYELDEDSSVKKFSEKPTFKHYAGTMIFCIEPSIFEFIPKTEKPELVNLTDHVLPKIIESGKKIFGYPFSDYWVDVGRLEEYNKMHNTQIFGETKKNDENKQD